VDRPKPPIERILRSRLATLDERIRESEHVTRALQAGEVDAVVVLQKDGASVYPIRSDEPLYRTIVEQLPLGVATLLPDGTIVYANEHLVSRMENDGGDLLGENLADRVVPADRALFRAMLHRALSSRQELETTLRGAHGEGPVLMSAMRLPVDGVEAIGLAIVDLRDQHARTAAEESSRAKDELLAAVSHELRTPLTSMLGWVQFLEMEFPNDPRITGPLQHLKNAVLAEAAIVDDLLDVSRTARGALTIAVKEFDVVESLRTAASFVELQAGNKGVALQVDVPAEPLPMRGDPDRLRQVFVNLLSNAVKFTHAPGTVDVKVHRHDRAATIAVSDSGMGIDPDFLPYVFEPFRRGDGTEGYPGLGIGLSIARSLVEAHGGAIDAASEGVGRGATFTVRLPLDG
jgi:signal transduction histidine kinase